MIFANAKANPDQELPVRDLRITNQSVDSTNQKFIKLTFFTNCFL